jgi:hypothetical protein
MMTDGTFGKARAEPRTKVFISYSRADLAFANRIVVALNERGFEPLIDRRDIKAAEKIVIASSK